MKKIYPLVYNFFVFFAVVLVLLGANSQSFAGKTGEPKMSNKVYILDVYYFGIGEEDEPYDSYENGINIKRSGQELALPVVGQVIRGKKVNKVRIYSDMPDSEAVKDICQKVHRRESVFVMPMCNLRIDVFLVNVN